MIKVKAKQEACSFNLHLFVKQRLRRVMSAKRFEKAKNRSTL